MESHARIDQPDIRERVTTEVKLANQKCPRLWFDGPSEKRVL